MPTNHDVIYRYSKGTAFTWNTDAVRTPYDLGDPDKKALKLYPYTEPGGRRFGFGSILAPAQDASSSLTYEVMGVTRTWRWTRERMRKAIEDGIVVQRKPGNVPLQKRYLDEQKGRMLDSVWSDIKILQGNSKEKTGYPTQKPLALYARMIEASSNPGDMVLDPFAGCATTCVAAEQLGRQWIGIDIEEESGGG